MRRLLIGLMAAGLCPGLASGRQPARRVDFSGRWVLNMAETKHLPQGIESCIMIVSQTARQLEVRTELKGKLRPRRSHEDRPVPQEKELPGGLTPSPFGEGPAPSPGGGRYGIGGPPLERVPIIPRKSGQAGHAQVLRNGPFAAFMLYPRDAVYNLNGSKSPAKFGGKMRATAISWAGWSKGGKVLKLLLVGNAAPDHTSNIWSGTELRDRWKLSNDGQSLLVERTVRTMIGPHKVHLVFNKQPSP